MKYLIFPDIHGRSFWKKAVLEHVYLGDYEKVIFLGDYVDPYPFENITVEMAISNLKEIVEFKKSNPEKIVLLLGNHDFYYFFDVVGNARWSKKFHSEITNIFESNRDCFQLAFETERILFTHSGFLNSWAEAVKRAYELDVQPTAESLNALFLKADGKVEESDEYGKYLRPNREFLALDMVSYERGGKAPCGSCIWADYTEHQYNLKYSGKKAQIFGHSLQLDLREYYASRGLEAPKDGNPIINLVDENEWGSRFAMLDCRRAFELDEDSLLISELNGKDN